MSVELEIFSPYLPIFRLCVTCESLRINTTKTWHFVNLVNAVGLVIG
jgi:hypothetical protein